MGTILLLSYLLSRQKHGAPAFALPHSSPGKCRHAQETAAQHESLGMRHASQLLTCPTSNSCVCWTGLQVLNLRLWSAAKPLVQVNLLDLCQRLALVCSSAGPSTIHALFACLREAKPWCSHGDTRHCNAKVQMHAHVAWLREAKLV